MSRHKAKAKARGKGSAYRGWVRNALTQPPAPIVGVSRNPSTEPVDRTRPTRGKADTGRRRSPASPPRREAREARPKPRPGNRPGPGPRQAAARARPTVGRDQSRAELCSVASDAEGALDRHRETPTIPRRRLASALLTNRAGAQFQTPARAGPRPTTTPPPAPIPMAGKTPSTRHPEGNASPPPSQEPATQNPRPDRKRQPSESGHSQEPPSSESDIKDYTGTKQSCYSERRDFRINAVTCLYRHCSVAVRGHRNHLTNVVLAADQLNTLTREYGLVNLYMLVKCGWLLSGCMCSRLRSWRMSTKTRVRYRWSRQR